MLERKGRDVSVRNHGAILGTVAPRLKGLRRAPILPVVLTIAANAERASISMRIIRQQIRRSELAALAEAQFGDMIKAVVDVDRQIMAVGGELHSDEEAALLDDGSRQAHLWGINLYPREVGDDWIEFDSMINVRPAQGNRSRDVESEATRNAIRAIVGALVIDG
jgi:hypothetical protein